MKLKTLSAIAVLLLAYNQSALAGTYTIPKTYANGDILTFTDLNAENTAIKAAVDGNDSDIASHAANASAHHFAPVVQTATASGISLGASYANVLTVTIIAPAAGNVILQANGMIQVVGKTSAGYFSAYAGISATSNGTPAAGNFTRLYLGTDSIGSFEIPYGVHAVLAVTAGSNTFYLVGTNNGSSGSSSLYYNRLTAQFID